MARATKPCRSIKANAYAALRDAGSTTSFIPIEGGYHNLRDDPSLPYNGEIWDGVATRTVEFLRRNLYHLQI